MSADSFLTYLFIWSRSVE